MYFVAFLLNWMESGIRDEYGWQRRRYRQHDLLERVSQFVNTSDWFYVNAFFPSWRHVTACCAHRINANNNRKQWKSFKRTMWIHYEFIETISSKLKNKYCCWTTLCMYPPKIFLKLIIPPFPLIWFDMTLNILHEASTRLRTKH